MDSIWTGTISFGLVTFPVAMFAAVDESEHVSFRQLHKKDRAPIRYRKFCSVEDVEVSQDEIVKGYEVSKGKYAIVEEEELKKVQSKLRDEDKTIEVRSFVDYASINPLSIAKPYYLAPQKGGSRPYAVLREALLEAKKVGIVRFFFRTRPILAALIPGKKVLSLAALRPFEELRDPDDLQVPERPKKAGEVKLARMLLDEMTEEWDPREHPDEYKASLEKLLATKRATKVSEPARSKEEGKVIDLMEALRRSVSRREAANKRRSAKRAG